MPGASVAPQGFGASYASARRRKTWAYCEHPDAQGVLGYDRLRTAADVEAGKEAGRTNCAASFLHPYADVDAEPTADELAAEAALETVLQEAEELDDPTFVAEENTSHALDPEKFAAAQQARP